jgi:hypothetical protein
MKKPSKETFILFCVLLFFVGFALVTYFWSGTAFYVRGYTPVVEQARERQQMRGDRQAEGPSAQPRPAGLRESEIRKNRGNGYSTY